MTIGRLLARYKTASQVNEQILLEGTEAFKSLPRVGYIKAKQFFEAYQRTETSGELEKEWELIHQTGTHLIAITAPDYPYLLKHIPDPPPLLYCQGNPGSLHDKAVAIVGSRNCSRYGREQSGYFSQLLVQYQFNVISGGALGIDAAAHQAALNAGGQTIAVLGSGLNRTYPLANKKLFEQIREHGCLISELPMNVAPKAEHFPRRNRIVSGLSIGVFVIEAALRSGALITARLALEEHGREVMALPGPVDVEQSQGSNKMIKEGWAHLIQNGQDLVEILRQSPLATIGHQEAAAPRVTHATKSNTPNPAKHEKSTMLELNELQTKIIMAVGAPVTLDALIQTLNVPAAQVQANLTMLEMMGMVSRKDGKLQKQSGS